MIDFGMSKHNEFDTFEQTAKCLPVVDFSLLSFLKLVLSCRVLPQMVNNDKHLTSNAYLLWVYVLLLSLLLR